MLRELRRALKSEGITFTVEMTAKAHPKLNVIYPDGTTRLVVVSSSPRNEGDVIKGALALIHAPRRPHGKSQVAAQPPP